MTWTYYQSTGNLYLDDEFVAQGYSGKGDHKNKPDSEHIVGQGPIPRGKYSIGSPRRSQRTGPYVLPLTPIGHSAHGRSAFQIHGDSISDPGTASSGCIILTRNIRTKIWDSGDHELEVKRRKSQ
ncbi:tlde1 domain-containing protein [Thaumasiovibrio subtropicus]|uniref:tlde1 domain-containing protein n=1 Tax=Thaumasiovibrio subtropicus TaxID=1891207 RepID=UPI000B362770|nr:tlde1 domain-containing protein [Thaumasiovibrio subtropicus]